VPAIHVQFQPDRVPRTAEQGILAAFRKALPNAQITSGNDQGRYVNFDFRARSAAAGWRQIAAVLDRPRIGAKARTACIVVCEGKRGVTRHRSSSVIPH
jgi:hypothetical protein